MLDLKVRARTLSALVGVVVACGGLAVAGGTVEAAEAATVTCPTVSATGVVTPVPTPGVDWDVCSAHAASPPSAVESLARFKATLPSPSPMPPGRRVWRR